MTAADLKSIFECNEYKQDLNQISSYLASISPETPMVHCLAKHLRIGGKHKVQLEAKCPDDSKKARKHDMVVDDRVRIEVKGTYDCFMAWLENELKKYGDKSLKEMWATARIMKKSIGWNAGLSIYADICEKKPQPDIFIWIICSRDLRGLNEDDRKRVCWSKEQWSWNTNGHPYPDSTFLPIADAFLKRLQTEIVAEGCSVRPFSILEAAILTEGDSPSTYHLRICDFSKQDRTG